MSKPRLPTDSDKRKDIPLASGCLDYFPDALAAVAELSMEGNKKHNPGEPLHWERSKSTDEADCMMRHFVERGTVDTDGIRHSVKVAWRALAMLQKELEEAHGLPISRGSRDASKLYVSSAPWIVPGGEPAEVLPRVVKFEDLRVGDRVLVSYKDHLGQFGGEGVITSASDVFVHIVGDTPFPTLARDVKDRTITLLERKAGA